jgi:ABC-type multidrug transport system ATPase subunit
LFFVSLFLFAETLGLDIGSKRGVWEIISNARKQRAFLLTTHSMEEAEVLCTKIGMNERGMGLIRRLCLFCFVLVSLV